MESNSPHMKILAIASAIIASLSSCTTTGHSHLEVTLLDKGSHEPLSGASLLAYYQTVVFGPIALPNRMKAVTDSRGIAEFSHLADGNWTVRADIPGRESQEAYFDIRDGRIDSAVMTKTAVGRVAENPCAKPINPALFLSRLSTTTNSRRHPTE